MSYTHFFNIIVHIRLLSISPMLLSKYRSNNKYMDYIDPKEFYTLKRVEQKLSKKQIGFIVVVLTICILLANHYDYLILN